jgi:predicted nuclease with RNAse H fold
LWVLLVLSPGVDISEKRGLDVVLLDGSPRPRQVARCVSLAELAALLRKWKPDVVAVDGPPAPARSGHLRTAEAALARKAIHAHPVGSANNPGWMRVSFELFRALAADGFPLYRRGAVAGTAIEVFPHASAVGLAECLPPERLSKKEWRRSVLAAKGIQSSGLRSLDEIDATLAALTGLLAPRAQFPAVGDPGAGVSRLPGSPLPQTPYRRCPTPQGPAAQLRLPGQTPCACGDPSCKEKTAGEFAPGHDAKRKSLLWKRARSGEEAIEELRRRGWKLPPGMR